MWESAVSSLRLMPIDMLIYLAIFELQLYFGNVGLLSALKKKPWVSQNMWCCTVSFNIYAWLIVSDYFLSTVCSMYSVYCYLICDHNTAVISYALVMLTDMMIYLWFYRNRWQ